MRHHGVSFHIYADDTQIYCSFETSVAGDLEHAQSKLEECVHDINTWMLHNLKLNDNKTEILGYPTMVLNYYLD